MSLFDALNAAYAQELFERYARNPDSVPSGWKEIFDRADKSDLEGLLLPEALSENGLNMVAHPQPAVAPLARPFLPDTVETPPTSPESVAPTVPTAPTAPIAPATQLLSAVARATAYAQAFRDHGHQLARVDPLGSEPPGHPQLDPQFFGTTMEELSEIPAHVVFGSGHDESLAEAVTRLRDVYCGALGFQFEHLEDPEKVRWLWEQVESLRHAQPLSGEQKTALLDRLSQVEGFEQFIHRTYLGQKRFSIEGTDMLVPMLDLLIDSSVKSGAREVMLGMAHRGRLNVLTHLLGVPYEDILTSFEGGDSYALSVPDGTGDVKYHMGGVVERTTSNDATVQVRLAPNPSHLEFVHPVVDGMVRRAQLGSPDRSATLDTETVVPVVIHGDAAFAAEGVVAETLNMARLEGYTVGGTIHIIANNQIGFTTRPSQGRSTRYSSDVAKGYDVPIIHVNADDPEACLSAVRLAIAFRDQFKDDFLIDLVGYRRHGHNEGDEPAYTQPRMYEQIRRHLTVRDLWASRLVQDGVIDAAGADASRDHVTTVLQAAQDVARKVVTEQKEGTEAAPNGGPAPLERQAQANTSIPLEGLSRMNQAIYSWPESFTVHPKLGRQLSKKRENFGPETMLDWGHGEALAYASLLEEGRAVRLTGQDAERGTFSHRHLVLHDVETGATITPIASIGSSRFEIYNSPLTETATMAFEYGYSVVGDSDLVLWEGQFGDFANVAQVIADQFLSSGHAKWDQQSGLVLLLPHGYEGQGPEHSSARLERYLQLCAENNMIVAYPTTPAQYFHMVRTHAHANVERPLIVMSPKSLLRLPAASSPVSDLTHGAFQPVIDDTRVEDPGQVRRVVLCSGKFYYDLTQEEYSREVAVVRVEELYPFPSEPLDAVLSRHPNLNEVIWAQEEPRNMGALSYIGPRLRVTVPRAIPLRHVSRPERASPAEGKAAAHRKEQARLVSQALTL